MKFTFTKQVLLRAVIALLLLLTLIPAQASEEPAINKTFGGDFTLQSTLGKPVSLSDYKGRLVLLNFGYTSCPDVCPVVLSKMSSLLKKLGPLSEQIQPLFITFDTERDSISHMREYLTFFHPSIVGLTGSYSEVDAVASLYGVMFVKRTIDSAIKYVYSHSDYVYLIDQEGRLRTFYSSAQSYEELEADIHALLSY